MFDELRDSLRPRAFRLEPDERRRVSRGMREALVHATLAVNDMRAALAVTEQRVRHEQSELDTVRRRQGLAADIGDGETVAVAERFAVQHAERVAMLESKRLVQQQELALAERECEQMRAELRRVMAGMAGMASDPSGPAAAAPRDAEAWLDDERRPAEDPLAGPTATRRSRAEREADADARLADLKRKLGR